MWGDGDINTLKWVNIVIYSEPLKLRMLCHDITCGTQRSTYACGLQIRRYLEHKFAYVLHLYLSHERTFRSEKVGWEMRAKE